MFGFGRRYKSPQSLWLVKAKIKKINICCDEPAKFFEDMQIVEARDDFNAHAVYKQYVFDMQYKNGGGYHYLVEELKQFSEVLRDRS